MIRKVLLPVTALAATLLMTGSVDGGAAEVATTWQDTAGPAIASAPPPRAPQLENTGIWRADPTRVCMTSAYRAGEFLYQGCVWDDQGGGVPQEWPLHTMLKAYTYPIDPAYRANAADLVELRAKPVAGATAFRLTYNTMTDPELVATTIALGDSPTPVAMPHGANTVTPARTFATVHGSTVDFVDATGKPLGVAPATVDVERRQVEVRVPHTVFDPTGQRVRVAAATGLWDRENNRYLVPQLVADATHPGGAVGVRPSAFFDVAFRYDEPLDSAWRDRQQKIALAQGNITRFAATIDFTKLAGGVDDDMTGQRGGVPRTGYIQRIYPTHFELAQGRRLPGDPGGPPPGASTQQNGLNLDFDPTAPERPSLQFGWVCRDGCVPGLAGQLQRYIAYVPALPAPAGGYGSLTWTPGYAQTPADFVGGGKDLYTSVANRPGAPTVVVAVDGRGNDNWFYGQSGASVFEAIADAARTWRLDPNRRVLGGFSSGAYGANKLSLQFPDYFSKAFPCDGLNMAPSFPGVNGIADTLPEDTLTRHEPGSELTPLLPSRRNQPVMEWAGLPDDFIPYVIPRRRADAYVAGDYDFAFGTWTIASGSHLVLCDNGTWDVLTRWLGTGERVRDVPHVTYVRNPLMDDPEFGLVGDHAYWLSGIESRGGPGTVDVFSHGFGLAERAVPGVRTTLGVATGTTVPLNAYTMESRALPAPAAAPAANRLDITATNIGAVTIDPRQAKVDCGATLNVTTDGPVRVTLLGCGPARTFG